MINLGKAFPSAYPGATSRIEKATGQEGEMVFSLGITPGLTYSV